MGFKILPFLGRLQNLLLPLYFRGNVSLLFSLLALRKVFDSVKELTYLVLPKIITVFTVVIIVAAELRTRNLS